MRLIQCKTAASPSRLPGLDWAVNPYRGCGHACVYCYAQDVTRFELMTLWGECIEAKTNIAQKLKRELSKGAKGVYGVGTVTDPYQPLEKKLELTRGCLSVLRSAGANASILTKSDLVLRDIDILTGWPGVEVGISLASLRADIVDLLESGAPSPLRRLDALKSLAGQGVRTYLMAAPIVCGLSDSEDDLRALVRQASLAGIHTIIWDKFNPKPMATSRMRRRFSEKGLGGPSLHSTDDVKRIRTILSSECRSRNVELLDAF